MPSVEAAIVGGMIPRFEHPAIVRRRRERDGEPVNDRRLRRLLDAGAVIRVMPGSFVDRSAWDALSPLDRHYLRVLEATDRARGEVILCHHAAAAVWGIDVLGRWPEKIDVRIERASGGRSSGVFRRRALGTDGLDLVPWRGHWITTPAQTAVDIAAVSSFTKGVVVLDRAMWGRRRGGPLATPSAARAAFEKIPMPIGSAKVERALAFGTSLSDSVRESQSRVLIDAMGFPAPVLQRRFELPSGRVVRPDFFFEEHDRVGEFDGVGKYLDPTILDGRTPAEALVEEKDRADELLRVVGGLSRWRTPALADPRLLYDILAGAGLPTRKVRPRAGQFQL